MKPFLPLLLLLCVGCTTVTPPKTLLLKERPKTPGRMETYWQVYSQANLAGDMPLRCVGGRIHFYSNKNASEPVKVNGDLTIFLFDANDPVPLHSVPVQQAVYKKEVLSAFHRKDSMGINGYDFLVPVDELGSEERDLQVIAVFHEYQRSGKSKVLIHSEPVVVTLSGPKRQGTTFDESATIDLAAGRGNEPSGITLASYQQPTQAEPESRKRSVETIQLPPHYVQAYQNDPQKVTPEKTVSPYPPREIVTPQQSPQETPQESGPDTNSSQGMEWPKTPGRLQDITQRNQPASNDRPFRIDSNTNPVHEDVSKSGRPIAVWVQ